MVDAFSINWERKYQPVQKLKKRMVKTKRFREEYKKIQHTKTEIANC